MQLGRARRIDGVHDRYIEFAKRTPPRDPASMVFAPAIDRADGAADKVVPEALWELGEDVVPIGVEPTDLTSTRNAARLRRKR